ncbi:STAS domain-containing protein [Nocardioides sp. CPCC 205120]|uniref:STAS domain-containing protein n=1 Tax=Nocardioides sp. CPCC 205120 TaxID=3406462 RepID=UPI003B513DD9
MTAKNDLEIRMEPDGSTIHVRGIVDQLSGPDLRGFLQSQVGDVDQLTVDLTDVQVLLAAGLRELDAGLRIVRDRGALVVVHAPEGSMAHRVMDVARRVGTQPAQGYVTAPAAGYADA